MVIVRHLGHHSHLFAAMFPDRAGWDRRNMLLAGVWDELRWLHWAKTVAASEGGEPPPPITRPGYAPPVRREGSKPKKPMPLNDETRASLAKQAGREVEDPQRINKLHNMFRSNS